MSLLRTKPLSVLFAQIDEKGGLKRTLRWPGLIALGIGAIIGAGLFARTPAAAAQNAGPGVTISFVIAALGCGFAGLCYAEFAAMIPVAGSAYTYAYATLGELFAWIIGWDLTLEYAMGASTVSSGWSNYFIEFLAMFGLKLPLWMAYDHWTGLKMATDFVARQLVVAANP